MKTTIIISGQINGNFTLRNAISANGHCEIKKGMFNSFQLVFETKKEAIKAIRAAYNYLCKEEPELKGMTAGIRASKNRTELYYDASSAIISENK